MELLKAALSDGRKPDLRALVAAIPYCRFLGVDVDLKGSEITTILRFQQSLIGNPILPALHGGAIGAFLEITAIIQTMYEAETADVPKPVDINIDYLRSGRPVDTYARAIITKQGRRVCNVRAEAWQDEFAKPIAALHGHFLITAKDQST
jgi:acyl-coenzyme A thioesterase PaaI-like protein